MQVSSNRGGGITGSPCHMWVNNFGRVMGQTVSIPHSAYRTFNVSYRSVIGSRQVTSSKVFGSDQVITFDPVLTVSGSKHCRAF